MTGEHRSRVPATPSRRLATDRRKSLQAVPFRPRVGVAGRAADFADEQQVTGDQQAVGGLVEREVIG